MIKVLIEYTIQIKFIYSEKATKFYEISTLLLSVCTVDKSKVEISQNLVAFSEYTNFKMFIRATKYILYVDVAVKSYAILAKKKHTCNIYFRNPVCLVDPYLNIVKKLANLLLLTTFEVRIVYVCDTKSRLSK